MTNTLAGIGIVLGLHLISVYLYQSLSHLGIENISKISLKKSLLGWN